MLYFFQRAATVIRCEIRLEWDGDGYELLIYGPGGTRIERFQELTVLARRWAELEGELIKDGWSEPDARRT